MNQVRVLIGFVLLFLLTSCSWFNRDNQEKSAPLPNVQNRLTVNEVWSEHPTDGAYNTDLALPFGIHNSAVYTVSAHGAIAALDNHTGKKLWKMNTKTNITSGVAVQDDHLAVGTGYAQVMVYRANDGKLVWFDILSNEILSKPTLSKGILLVKVSDGHLVAFDVNNGKRLWTYEHNSPGLSLRGSSSPVVQGDRVIVGFDDGKVVALSLQTGRVLWQQRIAEEQGSTAVEQMVDIDGTPLVVGDTVYVASYQGNIAALGILDGHIQWQHPFSSYTPISYSDNTLYATDANGDVYGIASYSGITIWKQSQLHKRGVTAPTVFGNVLVVGDSEGYLHWLDPHDGHFLAQTRFSHSSILTTPLVYNNLLYVVDSSGEIGCFVIDRSGG